MRHRSLLERAYRTLGTLQATTSRSREEALKVRAEIAQALVRDQSDCEQLVLHLQHAVRRECGGVIIGDVQARNILHYLARQ